MGFKTYKLVKGLVETLLRESPSHPVGFELYIANAFSLSMLGSPSHAVGLEWNNRVAITLSPGDKVMVFQLSPSHTVGLEQVVVILCLDGVIEIKSPSHAVGSEHGGRRAIWIYLEESPSHTVGLERL